MIIYQMDDYQEVRAYYGNRMHTERLIITRDRTTYGAAIFYDPEVSDTGYWRRAAHVTVPFFGDIELRWGRIPCETCGGTGAVSCAADGCDKPNDHLTCPDCGWT